MTDGLSANIDIFHGRRKNILLTHIVLETIGIISDAKVILGVYSSQGVDIEVKLRKKLSTKLVVKFVHGGDVITYRISENEDILAVKSVLYPYVVIVPQKKFSHFQH
jgi:hypothetical protein